MQFGHLHTTLQQKGRKGQTDRLGASKGECQLVVSGMSPRQQLALLGSGEPQSREAWWGSFVDLLLYPRSWALEMLLRG